RGKDHQQCQPYAVGVEEWHYTTVDRREPDVLGQRVHDEDVDADGWGYQPDLDHHDVDYPPPDGIVAHAGDKGEHERQGDDHGRDLVEDGAQDDVEYQDAEDDHQRREVVGTDPVNGNFGQP